MLNTKRLEGRPLPTDTYWVRVDDTTEAGRALAEAREVLQLHLLTDSDAKTLAEARQGVVAAEEALKACYEPITVTALLPDDFEALVDKHAPRPDTDDDVWNGKTFPRAVFLACAPTEWNTAQWEEWLKATLSAAEREALFMVAVTVNARVLDPTVPKGWTGIRD